MGKFKEKLIRFMYGRYGSDPLNHALLILYVIFALLNALLHWPLFALLMTADLIWIVYRMFSRNHAARRKENDAFMKLWRPIKERMKLMGNQIRECRTHVYHKCPHCKAILRLPRKKGTHSVRCPRCRESFTMKVYFGGKSHD